MIPARMASVRFPGKPLVDLGGKPMVQWVVEAVKRSQVGDDVVVATPDTEIIEAVEAFGGRAIRTSIHHPSGTDRIAEVAESISAEVYINVQGDEPLISAESIAAAARPLLEDTRIEMGSVWAVCPDEEVENPAVVKVVIDLNSDALYFSRHPLPYPRNERLGLVKKHVGIYAYRHETLARFATWSPSELEQTESLEQLRFLENGVRIRMSEGQGSEMAVDTPEQADHVRQILASR